jgi:hypothetical protein
MDANPVNNYRLHTSIKILNMKSRSPHKTPALS